MMEKEFEETYRYNLENACTDVQIINYQKNILDSTKYCYRFSKTSASNRTKIKIGEPVVAYCKSAFNSFIDSEVDFDEALDSGAHHPITGAFHIGDLLADEDILVCIDSIIPFYDRVWSITKSAGTLKNDFEKVNKDAFSRAMHLHMPPYTEEFSPMIGIIGTIPQNKDMGSGRGGDHGGNLDLPCVGIGSKIILPSHKNHSDIWFGDIHALQGNGELSGVALECSGEIRFRMYPIKLHKKTKTPIIIVQNQGQKDAYIYFVGCKNTFSNAVKSAMKNAIKYEKIWNSCGLINSYEKIGLFGDLVVGQAIGKTVSVAIKTQTDNINNLIQYIRNGEE